MVSLTWDTQYLISKKAWYLFYRTRRDEKLSEPWPVRRPEANRGPVVLQRDTLTTKLLGYAKTYLHMHKYLRHISIHAYTKNNVSTLINILRKEII